MTDIHSCSYYCDRPECIKAQRDELRERLAQPERKPLTDEEIETCRQQGFAHSGLSASFDFVKAARAIEAKLKEKNT